MRRSATSGFQIFAFCSVLAVLGCRAENAIDDPAGLAGHGRVGLALQVAPGVTVSSATYTITGPDGFSTTGTVSVGQSSDVPVNVAEISGGLPVGTGYVIDVTATTADGGTVCSGSTDFDVTAGDTMSDVIVHLTCRQPPGTGRIRVVLAPNICPVLDAISAIPAELVVGGSTTLSALAHDSDGGPAPLTFTWTTNRGQLAHTSSSDARFTCATAGLATITAAVSDGDPACAAALPIDVRCTQR